MGGGGGGGEWRTWGLRNAEEKSQENEVVELGGRIISHLNHTRRRRKVVLFHRYVLRGWGEDASRGVAKGRDPPSSRIHPVGSFLSTRFCRLFSLRKASEHAFSPSRRVNTKNTRKIHTRERRATQVFLPTSESSPSSLPPKRSFDKAAMHADSL